MKRVIYQRGILSLAAVVACLNWARAQNVYSLGVYSAGTAYWEYCSFEFPFPPSHFKLSGRGWCQDTNGFVIIDTGHEKERGGILHRVLDVDFAKESFTLSLAPDPSDVKGLCAPGDQCVLGVVMERGYPQNPEVLTAVADGSAGLYSTNGGVTIRGRQNPQLRLAAGKLMSKAGELRSACAIVKELPLPQPANTRIYIITPFEILSAEVEDHALQGGGRRLSPLFQAAQEVITQMRLAQSNKKAEPGVAPNGDPVRSSANPEGSDVRHR
jgi:hypothetical protein